jgi:hypothetical protein
MGSNYHVMHTLANQSDFNPRVIMCCVEQSETYLNDGRPQFVALAQALLKGDVDIQYAFVRLVAAGPDLAGKADTGQMTDSGQPVIDHTQVTDEDILAAVQADFPTVAVLYFDDTGAPLT